MVTKPARKQSSQPYDDIDGKAWHAQQNKLAKWYFKRCSISSWVANWNLVTACDTGNAPTTSRYTQHRSRRRVVTILAWMLLIEHRHWMNVLSTSVSQESAQQMQTSRASDIASVVADSRVTLQLHVRVDLQCGENTILFTLMIMTGHIIIEIDFVFGKYFNGIFIFQI
jgi:hypothetical protein